MKGRKAFPQVMGQLYFEVDPRALREAIVGALAGVGGVDSTLGIDERLAAANLGIYKQEQVGDRWSLLVEPATWDTMDEHGFAPHLFMPVERLLGLLAGQLRYLGSVPTVVAGALLVPLGCDGEQARSAFSGQMLGRTLDPPQTPDDVLNFPPELHLIVQSQAGTCRELIDAATQRYFALDHETFKRIAQMLRIDSLEETDTRAMAYLATLHSVTRSLEQGRDVLVTKIL